MGHIPRLHDYLLQARAPAIMWQEGACMAIWCRSGATATMPWSLSTYTTAQTAHTTTTWAMKPSVLPAAQWPWQQRYRCTQLGRQMFMAEGWCAPLPLPLAKRHPPPSESICSKWSFRTPCLVLPPHTQQPSARLRSPAQVCFTSSPPFWPPRTSFTQASLLAYLPVSAAGA